MAALQRRQQGGLLQHAPPPHVHQERPGGQGGQRVPVQQPRRFCGGRHHGNQHRGPGQGVVALGDGVDLGKAWHGGAAAVEANSMVAPNRQSRPQLCANRSRAQHHGPGPAKILAALATHGPVGPASPALRRQGHQKALLMAVEPKIQIAHHERAEGALKRR